VQKFVRKCYTRGNFCGRDLHRSIEGMQVEAGKVKKKKEKRGEWI
jgi:hypothetical protein